jgi:hypothetical protein
MKVERFPDAFLASQTPPSTCHFDVALHKQTRSEERTNLR